MTIMLNVTLRPGLFWQQIAICLTSVFSSEWEMMKLVCRGWCASCAPGAAQHHQPGPSPDYLVKVLQLLKINLTVKRIQSFL